MNKRIIILLLALPLLAGCSNSLFGGRHVNNYNTFSDGSSNKANIEADSETSDFIKDFLNGNTVPIQGGPGGSIPTGGIGDILNPTPTTPAPAPDPDDGTAPPPVIPGDSYRFEQGAFLFKVDEGGTHTVVLDPDPDQQTMVVIGASGTEYPVRFSGVANGNRAHFRASTIIRDFPATVSGSQTWTVGP